MVDISQANEPSRVKSKNEGLIPFNTITIFFLLLHKEDSLDSFLAIYPNNFRLLFTLHNCLGPSRGTKGVHRTKSKAIRLNGF